MITFLGVRGSRWGGLKGVLWTIFSRYIRKRDYIKHDGRCVSCHAYLQRWEDGDAGHYVSVDRGGFYTLFHEQNVNLQCKQCNNPEWTPDATIPYRYELDRRWGDGTADMLFHMGRRDISRGFSELEYESKIKEYIDKFEAL